MKYEDINYNEVLISGYINNITKLNKYIAFGLTCYTFSNTKSKCFISFDSDGVMVWNGKRCEANPFKEDDPEYLCLLEMMKEFE